MLVCLVPSIPALIEPTETARGSKHHRLFLLLLFLATFSLRLVYLTEIRHSPFYDSPVVDALMHHQEAVSLVEGDGEPPKTPYWKAPLYPWFLAAIYRIAGTGPLAPRLFQFSWGSLSPIRVFDTTATGAAAVIMAVYPLFYYFEGQLLTPPLAVVLNLVTLLLLLRTAESGRPLLPALAAGVAISLTALTRSQILLFVPFAAVWLFIRVAAHGQASDRHRAAVALAGFLIPLLLMLGGMTTRNRLMTGETIFMTSNSGINFYVGNGPGADGMTAVPVGSKWRRLQRMAQVADAEKGEPTYSGRFAWYVSEVFRFAREAPRAFVTLQVKKLCLFWSSIEIRNNLNIYFFRQWSDLLHLTVDRLGSVGLPYGILAPLSLAAIVVPTSRTATAGKRRGRTLLVLYVFSYMTALCAFFVCTRSCMPVLAVLICFAADAIVRSVTALKRDGVRFLRKAKCALAALLVFLSLAVLFNLDLGGVRHTLPSARDELDLATSLRARGDRSAALPAVSRGLAIDQTDPDAYYLLGVLYGQSARPGEAIAAFKEALVHDPGYAAAYHALDITYEKQNMNLPALHALERAVQCDPWFQQALVDLGTTYLQQGEFEKAAQSYGRAVRLDPSRADIRFWLTEARRRAA